MSAIGRWRKWLRAAFRARATEHEMQVEMASHIAEAAERFRARGMTADEALLAARREFGNVAVLEEDARDARGGRWLESAVGDLRHAFRHFGRAPLMALTIVLTLTLGIGVSSAAYGIVSGILTRPAPGVPDDKALVAIRGIAVVDGSRNARNFSWLELQEYARQSPFADVAGVVQSVVVTSIDGEDAGSSFAQFVTPNFFRTLGLRVIAGSGFSQRRVDDHAEPDLSVIMGHAYALAQFGTAEGAIGRTISVNGVNATITGVAPPRFLSAYGDGDVRTLWLPVSAWPVVDQLSGVFTNSSDASFLAVARLRSDVSIRQANPAVELVAAQASAAQPSVAGPKRDFSADVVPLRGDVHFRTSRSETAQMVGLMSALVVLVLLVCTTTVSSLLVGAAVTRRHEIAVRLALGASRGRIVRQLLTESLLLSVFAGTLGLLAYALVHGALRDGLVDADVGPTWSTAMVTALVAIATSVLCGLSPALHATRDGVSAVLKDSGKTATVRSRLQRVFVVAQIAMTQPLLVMLAVMIAVVVREGDRTGDARLAEHVVRAEFDTWASLNRADNGMSAIIQRVSSTPGVIAVIPQVSAYRAFFLGVPATPTSPARQVSARTHHVPPGYFQALDRQLVRGREFAPADSGVSPPRVVIESDFAAQAFGNTDPVGKRLATQARDGRVTGEVEIVGVVATNHARGEEGSSVRVFTPMGDGALGVPVSGPDALLIRTRTPASALIPTLREISRVEAPMLPVGSMKTLAQVDREARAEVIEATGASAAGGLITLFLASIGLYAVVALAVSQRHREIGVRISLGATPAQVVRMFFRSGLRVSLTGLAIGLPLSVAAWKVISSQMGLPRANVPLVASAVALSVVLVASIASWLPARRAAGADPLTALRDT